MTVTPIEDVPICELTLLQLGECAHCRGDHLPDELEPEFRPAVDQPVGVRVWPPNKPGTLQYVRRGTRRRRPPVGRCHWNPAERAWVTLEHSRDCRSAACPGCRPCGEDHCALRGICPNHVDADLGLRTCPRCIGMFREDLAEIVEIYPLVAVEAEHVGIDSEAASLAGPVSPAELDPSRRGHGVTLLDPTDELHPFAVLGRWDLQLRTIYGPPATGRITVTRSATYLAKLLAGKFPHGDDFEDCARSIAKCRAHMQDVLSDSRHPETGAPCPKCAALLEKAAAAATDRARAVDPDAEPVRPEPAGPLVKHYNQADKTGASDVWVCPDEPAHRWEEADYRLTISGDYLANATRLTAPQMLKAHQIKPGTLTAWATLGKVRKRGHDQFGRVLYDVADALAQNVRQATDHVS